MVATSSAGYRGAIPLYGAMPPALADKSLAQEAHSSNATARNTAVIVWSMILTEGSSRGMAAGDMKTFSGEAQRSVQYVRTPRAVPVTRPSKYTRAQVLAKIANLPDFDPQAGLNGDFTSAEAEIRAFHNSIYASLTPLGY
jgi:hypothetical protein